MTTDNGGQEQQWRVAKQKGMIAGWPVWYVQEFDKTANNWFDICACTGPAAKRQADRIAADHAQAALAQRYRAVEKPLRDAVRRGAWLEAVNILDALAPSAGQEEGTK